MTDNDRARQALKKILELAYDTSHDPKPPYEGGGYLINDQRMAIINLCLSGLGVDLTIKYQPDHPLNKPQ